MTLRENIKKELRLLNEQVNPCDWSNYPTWVSTWTNNNAFQNTMQNVNQPCQHICNKITQWTAMCANAGTNQQNILACKIAEGQNQHTIHNCSTSNASAC